MDTNSTSSVDLSGDGGGPPSFTYDAGQAHMLISIGAILTFFSTISVCARLYARYFIANRVGVDDYMAIGALVATFIYNVIQSVYAEVYLPSAGGMVSNVTASKLYFVNEIVYNLGLAFYKLTFLFQFFRIFRAVYVMRIAYIITIVIVSAWALTQFLLTMMTCIPISANWDYNTSGSIACLPVWVPTYLNASGTIITDIIVLVLPVPTLLSLRLHASQKWAVLGVFGIGVIVPIMSAGRIWAIGTPPPNGFVRQGCWTIAELSAGVITAGLATIRLLVSRHFPALPKTSAPPRSLASGNNRFLSKLQNSLHSRAGDDSMIQLDSRHSEVDLFGSVGAKYGDADRNKLRLGATTTITTGGKYDRSMADGAAEFLGEFGIVVDQVWEVTETIVTSEH